MEKKLEDLQTQINALGSTVTNMNRSLVEQSRRLAALEKFVLGLSKNKE